MMFCRSARLLLCTIVSIHFVDSLHGSDCDTPGWASCADLTGLDIFDCGLIPCDRDPIAWDGEGNPTEFGDQYCPKFAEVYATGQNALGGDVQVKITDGGQEGSGFTSWTTGTHVVCSKNYQCDHCEPPPAGQIVFTTDCKATEMSNGLIYADTIGVPGTECYSGSECCE